MGMEQGSWQACLGGFTVERHGDAAGGGGRPEESREAGKGHPELGKRGLCLRKEVWQGNNGLVREMERKVGEPRVLRSFAAL